ASEKVYQDFTLEVKNPGGHSSLPVKDNAIYHLAAGLARLAEFDFPVELNEVTRAFFERTAPTQTGPAGEARKVGLKSPPPSRADGVAALERETGHGWPDPGALPVVGTGATAGTELRRAGSPTNGVGAAVEDGENTRAHNKDGSIGVKQFYGRKEILARLV